jgi:hypothetical protein
MSDLSESHSIELLNPIPDMFIFRGSEFEFLLLALVSTTAMEVEILWVSLVLESLEYQPVICDKLHVGPSTVIFCSASEIAATGHAAKPLEQEFDQLSIDAIVYVASC